MDFSSPGPISFLRSLSVVLLSPRCKVPWLPLPCAGSQEQGSLYFFANLSIFLLNSAPFNFLCSYTYVRTVKATHTNWN